MKNLMKPAEEWSEQTEFEGTKMCPKFIQEIQADARASVAKEILEHYSKEHINVTSDGQLGNWLAELAVNDII